MKQRINPLKRIAVKVADIYRQEGKAFIYHLSSVVTSTVAGAVVAGCLENAGCEDSMNSPITTAVATVTYWAPFFGLLARSERNEMKDECGLYDKDKIMSKMGQYAAMFGVGELLYAGARGVLQYQLQKNAELDAVISSTVADLACATVYGLLIPPVKYGIRKGADLVGRVFNRKNSRKILEEIN